MQEYYYIAEYTVDPSLATEGDPVNTSDVVAETATPSEEGTTQQQVSGPFGLSPTVYTIGWILIMFAILYFVSIRPQKKQAKAMEEMQSGIKIGDPVLLKTGMYGTIVDVTEECFIVEFGTNKGIRIPVLKSEILTIREPNLTNKKIEVSEEK